jgi:NmrA-like family
VEIVHGDLDVPSTLIPAFTGATAIFSTTDFWASFYNPQTRTLLKPNQSLGEFCYEKELQQGKNIADAAAKIPNLERIVISSLCDVTKASGGKYKGVYHWDGKARAVAYLRERYPELEAKLSVVMMGNYMDNWLGAMKLRNVSYFFPII